jgi:fermentation-respiration switch protein FrsA (DUF1100 family)
MSRDGAVQLVLVGVLSLQRSSALPPSLFASASLDLTSSLEGMNFVVVNYRGYGASTGSPDPTKLQLDGVIVAKYLQTELGIVNLVAHGESVGGMVACNIARHVDLKGDLLFLPLLSLILPSGLIVDRSFTSLDALSRRMLGDWAGTGLQIFGRWKTDSLQNYLHSQCPHKIILQVHLSLTFPPFPHLPLVHM